MKKTFPECVWGTDDEVMGVNWINLMPYVIKSIQERKESDTNPHTHYKMDDIDHTLLKNNGKRTHQELDESIDNIQTNISKLESISNDKIKMVNEQIETITNKFDTNNKQFVDEINLLNDHLLSNKQLNISTNEQLNQQII